MPPVKQIGLVGLAGYTFRTMRVLISRTCLLVLLIAGVLLMPATHLLGAVDTACADQSAEVVVEKSVDDCCASKDTGDEHQSSDVQNDQKSNPGVPCDGPCDGSCDCSCCINIVRPAPIFVGTLASIVADDSLTIALLPTNRQPGQVALSVAVQPPIV